MAEEHYQTGTAKYGENISRFLQDFSTVHWVMHYQQPFNAMSPIVVSNQVVIGRCSLSNLPNEQQPKNKICEI